MLEVRPVWISCRCLKRLSRVLPRPLSSSPCVKTPNRVDLPASTLPRTATRRSKNCRKDTKNEQVYDKIWTDQQQQNNRTTCPQGSATNLLVIWHFANENFSNLSRYIRVIVHLSFSENSDFGANPVRQNKHKYKCGVFFSRNYPNITCCWLQTDVINATFIVTEWCQTGTIKKRFKSKV